LKHPRPPPPLLPPLKPEFHPPLSALLELLQSLSPVDVAALLDLSSVEPELDEELSPQLPPPLLLA
jgi:hypothetical protein